MRLTPAQGLELHVVSIAVREDLHIHLTAEHAIRRELAHEHAQVVACHAIGRAIQGKPTAANLAGQFNVLARLEIGQPWLAFNRAHLSLTCGGVGGLGQAHRHPAVVGDIREGLDQRWVDVVGVGGANGALVE